MELTDMLRKLADSLKNPFHLARPTTPKMTLKPPKLDVPSYALNAKPGNMVPNPISSRVEAPTP